VSPECQHVRELMDSYLSEELSVETNHLVLRHLATCEACAAEVRRRQRLRTLLVRSLEVQVDADAMTQRIAHAVDREQRSRGRVASWWGVAAALIVGVAATYWFSRPVDAAAYDDSAGNHVACAIQYPAAAVYDPARAARNLVPPFERIAEAIGLTHGAYHVIDAHMCPYNGRDYAHVVLRGGDQTLSLFVEPVVRGSLPGTPTKTRLAGDELDVLSTSRLGYRISATSTGAHRLFLVSERATETPDAITNEILLSAVRFVRTLER
jgi:anti-sigma factor RsiW